MIIKTVRFIESFIVVNPILKRLVPAKSVRFMEVSVSRELTVITVCGTETASNLLNALSNTASA